MDEELKEITLSSEVLSFPSGQRVDNISTVTEISDSEFDSKKTSLEVETSLSQTTSSKLCNPIVTTSNIPKVINPLDKLPPQLKSTLESNKHILNDKTLFDDLLQSDTHATNLLNIRKKFDSVLSHYCQGGTNLKSDNTTSKRNIDSNIGTSAGPRQDPNIPYLSVSSTPKKSDKTTTSSLPVTVNCKELKHVNFATHNPEMMAKNAENRVGKSLQMDSMRPYQQHSFTSYGPEIVFE